MLSQWSGDPRVAGSRSHGSASRWTGFSQRISNCATDDARGKSFISSQIADSGEFWWSERKPDERTLWQSKIVLSHEFFNEIIRHPVPLDMNTLKALTRSPLGLDLYVWLNYRVFGLEHPLLLTWPGFGHPVG